MRFYFKAYKTNVTELTQANKIMSVLLEHFPNYTIHFDLEDCDNVLCIKNDIESIDNKNICNIVESLGHSIEVLPD
jgi:hypothetical protein